LPYHSSWRRLFPLCRRRCDHRHRGGHVGRRLVPRPPSVDGVSAAVHAAMMRKAQNCSFRELWSTLLGRTSTRWAGPTAVPRRTPHVTLVAVDVTAHSATRSITRKFALAERTIVSRDRATSHRARSPTTDGK